ncbi:H-NS histone family protein [Paraburkholderia acidipaludis]|uniref:H-NS histone family protein n=1 Tax=Paraburkholderia acidipaludis TaxID=660537 RepID=UPI0005B786B2|nr:H-NS histone family protein [Paraburkholderia acidipaludis]
MSSYKELLAEREHLEEQLQAAFKIERENVLEEIMRKMSAHRITLDEIRGRPAASPGLAAKYRDPATGNEWSGRGRPPRWITESPDRSRFLVKTSGTALSKIKV